MLLTGLASSNQSSNQAVLRRSWPLFRSGLLAIGASFLLFAGSAVMAKNTAADVTADAAQSSVPLQSLPVEAQNTQRLIHTGGPFPNDKDGVVFGNRERQLPSRPRGHYREYTVKTPGARNRGARRIVCGGNKPTAPEVCYYTADHYASFQRIAQ